MENEVAIILEIKTTNYNAKDNWWLNGEEKQAGGHQNLLCGEQDAARPDDAALPIQDHTKNGPENLPALRTRQCGHLEKESL